jgi:ribosomal protein S12 methylthiotransferase
VNTCGFIDASTEESLAAVEKLARKKRVGQKLVVAGCMTGLRGKQIVGHIAEVDHVFGAGQWQALASLVRGQEVIQAQAPDWEPVPFDIPGQGSPLLPGPSAYLKISDGCNAPCTFCIIPQIKGRFSSVPAGLLVQEARTLVRAGARELVLVAQDSTAYGEDLGQRDGLPDLLRLLCEQVEGLEWLRVMYAYPGRVSPRLIEAMATLPQVVPYLDVPLQHGSHDVLKRMKRPHNTDMVRRMIEDLRAAMPDVALRTSFIVGFPGETEAEFGELLDFVKWARFDRAGVFTYSPQQGTPGADMPGQAPEAVKRRRYRRLMNLQRQISARKCRALVGKELQVLVEGEKDGMRVGRSYRDAPEVDGVVVFQGSARPGDFAQVRVTSSTEYDLIGSEVSAAAAL